MNFASDDVLTGDDLRLGTRAQQECLISVLEAWDKLQLEILKPVDARAITTRQWKAIVAARFEPDFVSLRHEAPFIGAHFTSSAKKEITRWAEKQTDYHDIHLLEKEIYTGTKDRAHASPAIDRELAFFTRAYDHDTSQMHRALFDKRVHVTRLEGGRVRESIAPFLHIDRLDRCGDGICYLARAVSLPFEVVRGRDIFSMSAETEALITAARFSEFNKLQIAADARELLRRQKLLYPVDIWAVAITFRPQILPGKFMPGTKMYPPQAGTMHCSAEVPPDGAPSLLFQSMGYLPQPQPQA